MNRRFLRSMAAGGLLLPVVALAAFIVSSGSRLYVAEDPGGGGDFATRCAAAGVVYCNGFDDAGDLAEGTVGNNCNSDNKSSLNTSVKASGASSLQFELASGLGGSGCRNIGGNWQYTYGPGFGAGSDLWVQYRVRGSTNYYSNNVTYWQSTVKQMNIHGSSSSCQNTETTGILYQQRMEFYHTCAGLGLITDPATGARLVSCNGTGGSCLLNQASQISAAANIGYNCNYQSQSSGSGNGPGCFWPVGDKWYTITIHYDLNTRGGTNNGYYAWESHDGGPALMFMNINGDGPWVTGGDTTYQQFWLETYMTESAGSAPTTAYVYYDELIISTQQIAQPSS